MCDKQYDVSEELQKLFELKQKQRAASKAYYLKLLYNPHRPCADGVPFDPQLQRFSAMSAYHSRNFRPSGRHYFGYFMSLCPVLIYFYLHKDSMQKKEEKLRSGLVKYSDRDAKWAY